MIAAYAKQPGWVGPAEPDLRQFGLKQMRVLMLTNAPERMNNMLSIVEELTQGRGTAFFLFGHAGMLRERDPLSVTWINGRREEVGLTD